MADYAVADLHFNHEKIITFSERKNFSSIEEHNEYIIKAWNRTVTPNDTVYILGDFGFGNNLKPIIERLKGYKILIKGNHDKNTMNSYLRNGINEVYNHPLYYSDHIILSHYPLKEALDNEYIINIHGHLHASHLNLKNFINANIALNNYEFIKLNDIAKKEKSLKRRKESFLNEWYGRYYVFHSEQDNVITDDKGIVDYERSLAIRKKKLEFPFADNESLLNFQSDFYSFHEFANGKIHYVQKYLLDDSNPHDTIRKIIDARLITVISELFCHSDENGGWLKENLYKMAVSANYIVRDYQIKHRINTLLTETKENEFKEEDKVFSFFTDENGVYHVILEKEYAKIYYLMQFYKEDTKKEDFAKMLSFIKRYINGNFDYNKTYKEILFIKKLKEDNP